MTQQRRGGHQSIFSADGVEIYAGEWNPSSLLAALGDYDWSGRRVLDIGANTGGLSLELARRGALVTAAEPDPYGQMHEPLNIAAKQAAAEILSLRVEKVELFDVHTLGSFDAVLCLGLIYHFRYPQLILDYLSTVPMQHLFLSTQVHRGDELFMMNRRDPSVLRAGFHPADVILSGWHPTRPLLVKMLELAGFNEIVALTDETVVFPQKPSPGLTNAAYYRATLARQTNLEAAKRHFYPR